MTHEYHTFLIFFYKKEARLFGQNRTTKCVIFTFLDATRFRSIELCECCNTELKITQTDFIR